MRMCASHPSEANELHCAFPERRINENRRNSEEAPHVVKAVASRHFAA